MKILEKTTRLVIEKIHGLPYEEAIKKFLLSATVENPVFVRDWDEQLVAVTAYKDSWLSKGDKPFVIDYVDSQGISHCQDCDIDDVYYPITIGRVIQALLNHIKILEKTSGNLNDLLREIEENKKFLKKILKYWKLTKENGQECTGLSQSDETIEAIYNLLKENQRRSRKYNL